MNRAGLSASCRTRRAPTQTGIIYPGRSRPSYQRCVLKIQAIFRGLNFQLFHWCQRNLRARFFLGNVVRICCDAELREELGVWVGSCLEVRLVGSGREHERKTGRIGSWTISSWADGRLYSVSRRVESGGCV